VIALTFNNSIAICTSGEPVSVPFQTC